MVIDFGKLGGPVYTGRARGEAVRASLGLDELVNGSTKVVVVVPENTYSVTSSFFLGLFGPSILQAGSSAAFFNTFVFNAPAHLLAGFTGHVERALQAKRLFGMTA